MFGCYLIYVQSETYHKAWGIVKPGYWKNIKIKYLKITCASSKRSPANIYVQHNMLVAKIYNMTKKKKNQQQQEQQQQELPK